MGEYDFDCPYGGLGNWQEHDSVCLVCQHDTECLHETEQAADMRKLAQARAQEKRREERLYGYGRTSYSTPVRRMQPTIAPAGTSMTKTSRPMPVEGETLLGRLGKNMLAGACSGAGDEFALFCEETLRRLRAEGAPLSHRMFWAGSGSAGTELGKLFEEYDFPPGLPPHHDDE